MVWRMGLELVCGEAKKGVVVLARNHLGGMKMVPVHTEVLEADLAVNPSRVPYRLDLA